MGALKSLLTLGAGIAIGAVAASAYLKDDEDEECNCDSCCGCCDDDDCETLEPIEDDSNEATE